MPDRDPHDPTYDHQPRWRFAYTMHLHGEECRSSQPNSGCHGLHDVLVCTRCGTFAAAPHPINLSEVPPL
jgi:hypothetical protein